MVSEPSEYKQKQNTRGLTTDQVNAFQRWKRPIVQALTLEVESGFNNLLGRQESFNSYVSRQLLTAPKFLPTNCIDRLKNQSKCFIDYPDSSTSLRRRSVVALRQYLQTLTNQYEKQKVVKPPRLNLEEVDALNQSANKKSNSSLSLNSSLGEIPGIGIKITERLASLSLFLVRDLLIY